MKIVISGGTGFVGRHLISKLRGQEVYVISRKKGIDLDGKLLRADMTSARFSEQVSKEIKGVDTVLHLAGLFSGSKIYQCNVVGTANMLEASRIADVQNFVLASTAAVYGECQSRGATEDDRAKPVTEYGLSKQLAEHMVDFFSRNYGIYSIILRFPTIYGPRNRKGVVYDLASRLIRGNPLAVHGDGSQIRDLLYVEDAVAGILAAVNHMKPRLEVYNISTGKPTTIIELIGLLEKIASNKAIITYVNPRRSDIHCIVAKNEKAQRELSFQPSIPLEEGLKRTVGYLSESAREIGNKDRLS